LSEKTVAVHRHHIRNKLKLSSPSELLQFAIRWQESRPARGDALSSKELFMRNALNLQIVRPVPASFKRGA
jgi:hypothetical protein